MPLTGGKTLSCMLSRLATKDQDKTQDTTAKFCLALSLSYLVKTQCRLLIARHALTFCLFCALLDI